MMSLSWQRWSAWTVVLCLGSAGAHAQTPPPGDPPAQAGRVAWVAGPVMLRGDAAAAPTPVQANWPVTAGNEIDTGSSGRAEVWVGSSALRLDVDTAVKIEQLDEDVLQVRLLRGALALRSASAEAARGARVLTPLGAVQPGEPGALRVDLRDGTVAVTAWRGAASFDGGGPPMTVQPGQRVDFGGVAGRVTPSLAAPSADDFRAFVQRRDEAFDGRSSLSSRYVSPEMTGAADLDAYGRWEQTPDYGNVWVPTTVAADWAPYREGRWVWMSPWGWTWVDAAPWGFAPFHYGRWALWQGRWCWAPGAYVARPVYAPALVGWAGGAAPARPGLGVSVSIGVGSAPVGWYPLAPHEAYLPPYRVSDTYVRNVNITHVTDVTRLRNVTNVTNVAGAAAAAPPAHHLFEHDARAATAVASAAVLASQERVAAHRVAFDGAAAAPVPGRQALERPGMERPGTERPPVDPPAARRMRQAPQQAPQGALHERPHRDAPAGQRRELAHPGPHPHPRSHPD